jgi:hypothetical protein
MAVCRVLGRSAILTYAAVRSGCFVPCGLASSHSWTGSIIHPPFQIGDLIGPR